MHGLIYFPVSDHYCKGITLVFKKSWYDIIKKYHGIKLSKYVLTDDAYGKCNNVSSWRTYITKEHIQYKDDPAYADRSAPIPLTFNL